MREDHQNRDVVASGTSEKGKKGGAPARGDHLYKRQVKGRDFQILDEASPVDKHPARAAKEKKRGGGKFKHQPWDREHGQKMPDGQPAKETHGPQNEEQKNQKTPL